MAGPKIRRVDFYPDEWLTGTRDLALDQRAVYITACALIYSRGGPVSRDRIRSECAAHRRTFNRVLDGLIALGKLRIIGELIDQERCEIELKRARNRVETSQKNGRNGGRQRTEINDLEEPEALELGNANEQPPLVKESRGELGRSAPSERDAPTAEDIAYVERATGMALAALNGGMPKSNGEGAYEPIAYRAAIGQTKRDAWLNNLSKFVASIFDGDARIEGWEAIEAARGAGSRRATPHRVRKLIDKIDTLYRQQEAIA